MKKMLALILALAMVLSMSVSAFAATIPATGTTLDDTNNKENNNVSVTITGVAAVYHVVINWEDLAFAYTLGTWNVKTHEYNDDGSWTDNKASIKVENHSNAAVEVTATIDQSGAQVKGVTATVNVPADNKLDSADDDAYRTTDSAISGAGYKAGDNLTITVEASGNPQITGTNLKVGTVTVTITPNP